ncbi:MAG: RsmE family RNA methyltransferase, partial [bacterium]
IEEAELSRSPFYPEVKRIRNFKDVLEELEDIPILIAYERAEEMAGTNLFNVPEKVALITGPEGGFSEREISLARGKGAKLISLGENIISAEFAPLILATLVLFSYRFDIPLRVS